MIGYRVAKPVRRELDLELCPKPALGRNGFRRALRFYEWHGFIKSFSYASLGRPGWEKRGIQASRRFWLRNGEWRTTHEGAIAFPRRLARLFPVASGVAECFGALSPSFFS